jgi:exodeoxyribonuclease V alpha subunit
LKARGEDSDANIENDVLRAIADSDFMILTGGPGTGKTTMTITAIALMLTVSDVELRPENVALCAPTGKAAARLKEAIQDFLNDSKRSAWITQSVRDVLEGIVPTTIHRLLSRSQGMSTRFRHNAQSQLSQSIVAVDEASMISAQLMARLLEAISRDARVLLVGDPGQLESVEAGAVLGQLMLDVSASKSTAQQRDRCVFTLKKVWRTGAGSAIPKLAAAIQSGDAEATVQQMKSTGEGLEWIQTHSPQSVSDEVAGDVVDRLLEVKRLAQEVDNPVAHMQALANASAVKVLCGPREGGRGVAFWNQWLSEKLGFSTTDTTSPGRLVMVLENSPRVSLANGDIGLIVAMGEESQAIFPGPTGPRYLPLASLPPVQTCFAMTIHKSQGSEYRDLVVVVLPGLESPLLNRQLFYTAVTRTKNRVRVVGSEECLRQAVLQVSGRASGLAELLRRNLVSHE